MLSVDDQSQPHIRSLIPNLRYVWRWRHFIIKKPIWAWLDLSVNLRGWTISTNRVNLRHEHGELAKHQHWCDFQSKNKRWSNGLHKAMYSHGYLKSQNKPTHRVYFYPCGPTDRIGNLPTRTTTPLNLPLSFLECSLFSSTCVRFWQISAIWRDCDQGKGLDGRIVPFTAVCFATVSRQLPTQSGH